MIISPVLGSQPKWRSLRFRISEHPASGVMEVFAINPDSQRRWETFTVTYPPLEFLFLTIAQPDEQDRMLTEPTIRLWGRHAPDATVAVNGIAIPAGQMGER